MNLTFFANGSSHAKDFFDIPEGKSPFQKSEVRSYAQLKKLQLDLDSPQVQHALQSLGIRKEECILK